MRVASVIKGLKNSQKIFLAINGVAMYTTVGATDSLAYTTQRAAVQSVLIQMASEKTVGMSRTVRVYDDKMEQVMVEVGISLC
jgi:hypothetical protein